MPELIGSHTNTNDTPPMALPAPRAAEPMRVLEERFPLLLALASDEPAVAAIRLTQALALSRGAVPTVLRALGDVRAAEASASPLAGVVVEEYLGPDYLDECRGALEQQVTSVAGEVDWKLWVTDEMPVDAIVEGALALRAGLIVMGLRRHGVLRRMITRDLLAEVVRVARVPVLAIRPDLTALPQRIVVAVDFGPASIRAAHLARRLLADNGALYLVHVTSVNSDRLRRGLDRIAADLEPAGGVTTSSILLHGDIQSAIEGCAQALGADLLAVGSEEHSLLDRITVGRMSMKLAHTARWSMLIAPSPTPVLLSE